jgi:hypothetical protein
MKKSLVFGGPPRKSRESHPARRRRAVPDRRQFVDRAAHACAAVAAAGGLAAIGPLEAHGQAAPTDPSSQGQRILIIGMTGSENPTRANFTFAWGARLAEDGHEVRIQLVGDAPVLIRDEVLDNTAAVGWPPFRGLFDRIRAAEVPIFL